MLKNLYFLFSVSVKRQLLGLYCILTAGLPHVKHTPPLRMLWKNKKTAKGLCKVLQYTTYYCTKFVDLLV